MFNRLYGTQNPTPLDSEVKKDKPGLKHRLFQGDDDRGYDMDNSRAMSPPPLKRPATLRREGQRSQRLLDQDENGSRPRSPTRKQYSVAPILTRSQAHRSRSLPSEHHLASKVEGKRYTSY